MKKQGDKIDSNKDLPWPNAIDRPICVTPALDYKFSLSDMPQEWIHQHFGNKTARRSRVVSCMPDIGRRMEPPSRPYAKEEYGEMMRKSKKANEPSPLRNTIHSPQISDYDDDFLAEIVDAYSVIQPEEIPDLTDDSHTLSSIDTADVEVLSIKKMPRCVQTDFRSYSNSQHQSVDAKLPPITPTHKVSMKKQPSDYVIMRTGEGKTKHYHARAEDVDVTKFTRACSFRKNGKYGQLEKPQPLKEPSSRVSSAESYFRKMGINKFYSPGYKKQLTQLQVIN